jgi:hypothetical protein
MDNRKIYKWNRFWSPRTGQLNLGDGGFLWDPENEYGSMYNPDVKSFPEIEALSVLGLLGEPGIGKSFAMMNLVDGAQSKISSVGGQILYVDLRSVGSESRLEKKVFESPEFQVWNTEKVPLYIFLDSLDECLLSIQTASRLLADELRRYPHHNLFLRIACRTWDWPIGLEVSLKEHWGEESVGIFELAPLRRKDVVEAVLANELDPGKFIEEVQSREVVPLAIKPLTLEMLMNIFKHGGGLPSSKIEIYRRGCLLLADEPNQDRRDAHKFGTLSQQQRLITAGRIAALTIFAGKNAIWTGLDDGNMPNEDLILTNLVGGSELIDGNLFEINESALRETLSSGLFTSRGVHRMGWAHQTYAEFLAALYLTSREVSQSQIASLLFHPASSGGKLVPQLAEVTAWLASMNHSVFSLVMEVDPEVILRGDMSSFDDEMKKALVQKLLWLYDEGGAADSDWDLRSFYYKLDHPDLADQLKSIITDNAKGVIVKRVAIDIAEACELKAIQAEILNVALNPMEVDHIRTQAACAIWRIGDETAKRALLPLAEGSAGNDPDDELKGYALKSLWPDYISAESLFACLTPPKKDSFIGSYHYFLTDNITPSLTTDNIAVALSWVEASLSGWRRIYVGKKLVKRIIAKATELLDAPSVAASFSKLILNLLTDHNYEIIEALSEIKANDDVRNRQRITNAVLSMVESHQGKLDSYYYPQMGFVRTEDVPWLIECCRVLVSNKAKRFLADIIQQLFVYEQSDMILTICENEKVFADVFKVIREPIRLDSPEADKMREYAQRPKTERKKITPSPMLRIINSLDEIEAGAPAKWVDLLLDMAIDDYGYGSWPDSDMHNLPGWQNADPSVKARIVTAAKYYLINGEPEIDSLFEDSTKFVAVASDYAIQLLLSEDEQFIQLLNSDTWKKWAKVMLAWSARRDSDGIRRLLALAYNRAPEQIIEGINQIIEKDKKGSLISLWQVEHIWDEQIAETLFGKLNDPGLTPTAQAGLLKLLIEQRVAEAQRFAEALIPLPLPEDGDGRTRAILAAEQLISHAPDAGWSFVWPAIQADSEFGLNLITKVSESAINNLSDEQVANMYIWLEQNKPQSEKKGSSLC